MSTEFVPDKELGWLAGIIDGEGNISIEKRSNSRIFSPRVIITNTNFKIINKARQIYKKIGVSDYCIKRKRNNCSDGCIRKPCYDLQIHKLQDVLKLLLIIKGYSIGKNEKINLLIRFCKHRINKRSKVTRNADAKYGKYEYKFQKKLAELNRKGVL